MGGAPTDLLDAAERLIAARGVEGVSLREIGAAAGHRNNSAAQYHFGSKEGLLAALFERRMRPINERRLAMLATVADGDVRGLVDACFRPYGEAVLVDPPTGYAGFIAQVVSHPAFEAFRGEGRDVTAGLALAAGRLLAALADLGLDADVAADRFALAGAAATHRLAALERQIADGGGLPDVDAVLDRLVDALVGLLTAPVTASPRSRA